MSKPYAVTHLLSYSPQHKDAVSVDEAVRRIRDWKHAIVGSTDDVVAVLIKLGYTPEDIATTMHFAFLNSPIKIA